MIANDLRSQIQMTSYHQRRDRLSPSMAARTRLTPICLGKTRLTYGNPSAEPSNIALAFPPSPPQASANLFQCQQRFQKDAVLRQMKEYKREKGLLETQLADMTKRSLYHDDHLRIIDVWFAQVSALSLSTFAPSLTRPSHSCLTRSRF